MQMQAEPTTPQGLALARPRVVLWIGIAIALTTQRLMVVTFLPTLEMFDGVNPDAWFAPWISDTVVGLLATQWIHPQQADGSNSTVIFGIIVLFLAIQSIVALSLFRTDVIRHFTQQEQSA